MKRLFLVLVLIFLTASIAQSIDVQGIEQGTIRLLRHTGNEDPCSVTADITTVNITNATAGDFDHMPDDGNGVVLIESDGRKLTNKKWICVMACARSAADKTFTVNYWLWFADKGPAIKAMSVAYTTGTQKVVKYPHSMVAVSDAYWADSGTITKGLPLTIGENDDGLNNVKMIVFDSMGAYAIYAEVTGADGTTGAEAGDVTVYWFTMSG